jgi:hypothetical protein
MADRKHALLHKRRELEDSLHAVTKKIKEEIRIVDAEIKECTAYLCASEISKITALVDVVFTKGPLDIAQHVLEYMDYASFSRWGMGFPAIEECIRTMKCEQAFPTSLILSNGKRMLYRNNALLTIRAYYTGFIRPYRFCTKIEHDPQLGGKYLNLPYLLEASFRYYPVTVIMDFFETNICNKLSGLDDNTKEKLVFDFQQPLYTRFISMHKFYSDEMTRIFLDYFKRRLRIADDVNFCRSYDEDVFKIYRKRRNPKYLQKLVRAYGDVCKTFERGYQDLFC